MGDVFSAIQNGLLARGFSADQAHGITAGIYAEGGVTASGTVNVNPTSGAYGLGQWLGARKQRLFTFAGTNNPTLNQQLDFLVSELRGGDPGGRSVLGAGSAGNTLTAYITRFMRPAAGAETTGDLSRGNQYLASATNATGGYGRTALTNFLGASWGNSIADDLSTFGGALAAPGDAIDQSVNKLIGGLNPSQWFQRIAIAILAILLIGIALAMLAGKPVSAIASKVPVIPV